MNKGFITHQTFHIFFTKKGLNSYYLVFSEKKHIKKA